MAESKRIFAKGRMNRDIDDRLLPEGEYRDALNVNVGKSEGGDIGAVENLKGNMEIPNQTGISGTTIGVVRDPNEDRIYWFNTSDTADGIYEYDQSTGEVNTLVQDIKRDVPLPTCAPTITIAAIEPDSNTPDRPDLPGLPAVPTGVCADPAATNTGTLGPRNFANNALCNYEPRYDCSGAPSYNCNERTDGGGIYSSLGECQGQCQDPGGGSSGGGSPRRAIVTGCPSDAQTADGIQTVTLTVTTSNFTGGGDVTVTVTGYTGPDIIITGGNGSATFDVTSATVGQVVYTPDAQGAGQRSVQNRACTIGWGEAPPVETFVCRDNNSLNARCEDPGDGSGMSLADCNAGCNVVAPPTNIAECNTVRFESSFGQNVVINHFGCRNDACPLFQPTLGDGDTMEYCIQRPVSPPCSGVSTTVTLAGNTSTLNGIGYVVTNTFGIEVTSGVVGTTVFTCDP